MFLALKKKKQLDSVENSNQDTSYPDEQIREDSDFLDLDFEDENFEDNVLGGSLEPQNYHSHYEFVKNRKSLKIRWVHFLLNLALPYELAQNLLVEDFYPKRIQLVSKKTSEWKMWIFDFSWTIKQVLKVVVIRKKN